MLTPRRHGGALERSSRRTKQRIGLDYVDTFVKELGRQRNKPLQPRATDATAQYS